MQYKIIRFKDIAQNNPRLCLSPLRALNQCHKCPHYFNCESKIDNKKYEKLYDKKKKLLKKIKLIDEKLKGL